MRPEVKELLTSDWPNFDNRVREIVSLELTSKERLELCQLLEEWQGDRLQIRILTGVMWYRPDPIYVPTLARLLESPDQEKAGQAAIALLNGKYSGAIEMIFRSENALSMMEDALPWEVSAYASELTESMQHTILDLFVKRFGTKTPCLDAYTHPWFRLLAQIPLRDDRVANILVRIWHEVHFWDSQERYLLLQAMSGSPHPSYERIFKKMSRSKVDDLRELADNGLQNLPEK